MEREAPAANIPGMDDQRVGSAFRALRIQRNWTQSELAKRVGVSAGLISLVERGHLDSVSMRVLRPVVGALDCRIDLRIFSGGGEVGLLLNAWHVALRHSVTSFIGYLPSW